MKFFVEHFIRKEQNNQDYFVFWSRGLTVSISKASGKLPLMIRIVTLWTGRRRRNVCASLCVMTHVRVVMRRSVSTFRRITVFEISYEFLTEWILGRYTRLDPLYLSFENRAWTSEVIFLHRAFKCLCRFYPISLTVEDMIDNQKMFRGMSHSNQFEEDGNCCYRSSTVGFHVGNCHMTCSRKGRWEWIFYTFELTNRLIFHRLSICWRLLLGHRLLTGHFDILFYIRTRYM